MGYYAAGPDGRADGVVVRFNTLGPELVAGRLFRRDRRKLCGPSVDVTPLGVPPDRALDLLVKLFPVVGQPP
jgi:hypothetical protein